MFPVAEQERSGWIAAALGLTILAAYGLRVHALGQPNLTGDEWFMLRNHDQGPAWIIHQARTFEPHPLLYYLGLAGWIELTGRTAYAMRYLSVVFGVCLIPALYGVTRQIIGMRAGLIVALLGAINPYQIAESQNARNYALAAVLSVVATLAFVRALKRNNRRAWVVYVLAAVLALNSHYGTLLIIGVHALYLSVILLQRRFSKDGRALLGQAPFDANSGHRGSVAIGVVLALFAAWMVYAWPAVVGYHGYFPKPVGIAYVLARSLATFTVGENSAIRSALGPGIIAALGLVWLGTQKRWAALLVGLYVAVPIALVGLLFLFRPMFDPRYLIVMAPGYLILIGAGIDGAATVFWPAGLLGLAALGAIVAPAVPAYYAAAVSSRSDFRGMATWVANFGNAGDPVVATGFGQAELFGYYANQPARLSVLPDPAAVTTKLPGLLQGAPRGVWLLPYLNSPSDATAQALLAHDAFPVAEQWFVNVRALYFGNGRGLQDRAIEGQWGDRLALAQVGLPVAPITPGEALLVRLIWKDARAVNQDLKYSLRLTGPGGQRIAQADRPLTIAIVNGQEMTRGGLLIPLATPPGAYRVSLVLYHANGGQEAAPTTGTRRGNGIVLGTIGVDQRQTPADPALTGIPLRPRAAFGPDVSLLGAVVPATDLEAGATLHLRLLWRAGRTADRSALVDRVEIVDAARKSVVATEQPVGQSFPLNRWRPSEIIADDIALTIPATAPVGQDQVALSVLGTHGTVLGRVALGPLLIAGPQRTFSPPSVAQSLRVLFGGAIELVGTSTIPTTIHPGGQLPVTLYWGDRRALTQSEKVFVHVVDPQGKIVGQEDQIPVGGSRPTNGWVPGEYLTDPYSLQIDPTAAPGRYSIEVGLYDPTTGQRLGVQDPGGHGSADQVNIQSVAIER